MSPTLRLADLARLEKASCALVSPLVATDINAWRQRVLETTRALFNGRSAFFALPHPGIEFYGSTGVDETAIRDMTGYIAERARMQGEAPDPLINHFYQRREELQLEVFDGDLMHQITGDGQRHSAFYNEVWARHGLHRVHVLYVTTPAGVANLHVHHEKGQVCFDGGGLAVLRVLLPSFKAGLEAVQRLSAHRAALAATLDVLTEPLAAFNADGHELHRNAALTRLVDDEPERVAVETALARLAQDLRRLAFPLRGEGATLPTRLEQTVATARGRYRLRPSVVPEGLAGPGSAFLVTVAPSLAPVAPPPDVLRERFGLTRREAEVALLIADGLRNDAIAERLFVASGTVRRHTEGVLAKLEVTGRAAVARTLLQPA